MSNKRNILILLPNDSLGGAEQFLKMLGDYLGSDSNICVYVVFFKKRSTGSWDTSGHKLFYGDTDKERYGVFQVIRQLFKLRKVNFDYIFTSHVHTNSLIGLMRRIGFVKSTYFIGRESTSIFFRYGGVKLIFFKIQYKLGYSAMDLLICQSSLMRKQLLDGLPWLKDKTKIEVIGNPINLDAIIKPTNTLEFKEIADFNYIVSAGRLIEEKGFDILIESFVEVKKIFPTYKLLILGEGKLRSELESKIRELSLINDVLLIGFVKNVFPYFKKAKVCVVSSRIEGFPNVLLQMMSQNNNIVSTLCAGGIAEIKGIYTVDINNVQKLSQQIIACILNDNSKNRILYDIELDSRSVVSYFSKIENYLNGV